MKVIDFIDKMDLIFTHMHQKRSKIDHMSSKTTWCNNFMNQIMFRVFYLPSLHSVSLCALAAATRNIRELVLFKGSSLYGISNETL